MKNYNILIVEDEVDIASILKLNLESDGFNVSVLNDGSQVVEMVEETKPDLILLDVMIPEKDGFEVCKEIKANQGIKHIPIIFLTAKTLEHNVVSGLEIGADDYITKPFSISVVISRIKAVLRRSKIAAVENKSDATECHWQELHWIQVKWLLKPLKVKLR